MTENFERPVSNWEEKQNKKLEDTFDLIYKTYGKQFGASPFFSSDVLAALPHKYKITFIAAALEFGRQQGWINYNEKTGQYSFIQRIKGINKVSDTAEQVPFNPHRPKE